MLTLILLAYLAIGLLMMDYMCPLWHPIEKLIGAVIWPAATGIGIWRFFRKEARDTCVADGLLMLCVAMLATTMGSKKPDDATRETMTADNDTSGPDEPVSPTVGFRQCPVCKTGFHWNCPGGEWVDPKDKSKGHYMCDCGCEAAA